MATDEIELEPEIEEEAYVEYDIATYPSDNTIDVLHQMKRRGDIVIPKFQRNFVWTIKQASLLVESFLLGLPVPPLFFYINEENKSEVIDGQQRLMSMIYFLDGYFGEPDLRGRRQVFRLTGLSNKSPFIDHTFNALDEKFQRKLRSSVLRAINIRQLNPVKGNTSVFHIFERLNTGGTSLKPQEIRNAVFRGKIVSSLRELNANPKWKKILGLKRDDKFQRDIELILRLFALFEDWQTYEKPMKEYLNISMKSNSSFTSQKARNFVQRFPLAIDTIVAALGDKPFRPRRVINAAILEAVFVNILENPDITSEQLAIQYPLLIDNDEFGKVARGATTDTYTLRERLSLARRALLQ